MLGAQPLSDDNFECLPREHVHDRQRREPSAVDELVGDEVQGPRLLRPLGFVAFATTHNLFF